MKKFTIFSSLIVFAVFLVSGFIVEPAQGIEIKDARFCVCFPQGCMCEPPKEKK